MSAALPWIAILISALSAVFTWVNIMDRRGSDKTIHVSRVSMEVSEKRDDVTEDSSVYLSCDITVRNDGPSAVTIVSIARAYGQQWALDEQRPFYWKLDTVPQQRIARRLLPPGEDLTVEGPADRTDINILGPVVTLVDTNGRQWQRCELGWRELPDSNRGVPRRHLWFDRRPWLHRIDAGLFRRAQWKALRHPRRVPWELHLIDVAWGYRPGPRGADVYRMPWDAPRTWHYPDLFPSCSNPDVS